MNMNMQSRFSALCVCALFLTPLCGAVADSSSTFAGPEKIFTGIVTAVDPGQHTLKVHGELFFNRSFNLGDACSYTMLNGVAGAAGGLHPGQKIQVTYQNVDGVLVADRITQQPMCLTGWVKAVDRNAHTLTVQPGGMGLTRQLRFPEDSQVTLLGGRPGTPADIQPGNHVSVTFEEPPGLATVQNISQTSETFTGALTAIDLDAKTVKAKTLLDTRSFNLGEHCVIDLDGKNDGRLSDLRPEEKLVFTYDDINGVNVVNRIALARDAAESASAASPPGGS